MRTARRLAFVILDGTLLPIDRIAADTLYYSGKHKPHDMNVQVLTDPFARPAGRSSTRAGDLGCRRLSFRQHGDYACAS